MTHKFYNVTGEGAGGGGEKEREIPQSYKNWATAYADTIADDSPKSFRDHLGAELYNAMCVAYRHLSPSSYLPIPHDIISFWDEVLKKPILCPDESQYFEWCYWMLKNEHPVHQIQLENEVDKVVYTVGHIVKEPYQDTMVEHTVKSLHWRGNYWYCRYENGDGISINGPIKGDDYHRDRFERKSEKSPSPSPGLRWVKAGKPANGTIDDEILHIKPFKKHHAYGILPKTYLAIIWMGKHDGGLAWHWYEGPNSAWHTKIAPEDWEQIEWLDESPSLPGEQDQKAMSAKEIKDANDYENWHPQSYSGRFSPEKGEQADVTLMTKAIRMRDAYNSYIHTLAGELFVFRGGRDRGVDHFKEQQDARNALADALKPFIGTDLQPPLSPEAPLRGEQVADPLSLYKASIGVSELSAEKGEQVEVTPEAAAMAKEMMNDLAAKAIAPSVEADQQVPRQSIADVCGNIPVGEAFRIAKWVDAEIESLIASVENWEGKYHQAEEEVAALRAQLKDLHWTFENTKAQNESLKQERQSVAERFSQLTALYNKARESNDVLRSSGRIAGHEYRRDIEIVKGERNELHDLLNILYEGCSDHFTKFLNDRMYKALNTFPNNTKGE